MSQRGNYKPNTKLDTCPTEQPIYKCPIISPSEKLPECPTDYKSQVQKIKINVDGKVYDENDKYLGEVETFEQDENGYYFTLKRTNNDKH